MLGVDWLGSLGPVTFDFNNLQVQFQQRDEKVTLQGNSQPSKPTLQQMTAKQYVRSCQRQGHGFIYLIQSTTKADQGTVQARERTIQEQCNLNSLIQKYEDFFSTPVGLPLKRSIEHSIELKEGTEPFSTRPYRNSYDQKNEIEKLIGEMLEIGIIRPSSSPFASPILLVKKKDGSWRFCIDYRSNYKE